MSKETKDCYCTNAVWAVFNDLLQAVDRMERDISDQQVKQWFVGYRDGVVAALQRYKVTRNKCCCERTNEAISK